VTRVEIKILLLKKGLTQGDIAKKLKVTPGMICGLIGHRFKSRRLQESMAAILEVDSKKLWDQGAD
jgi:hypothetical protein